jgi:hypothetical protein
MQSFSSYTDTSEAEQLDEINLKRAIAPAIALSFAFRKSKDVKQKLKNVQANDDIAIKIDELADALALTDSKVNAIFSMLLFLSKRV